MINKKASIVMIISMILLSCYPIQRNKRFNYKISLPQISTWSNKKRISLRRNFNNTQYAEIILGYVIGFKRYIKKNHKNIHIKLCLMHLFTPSGIHLAAMYLFLSPIFFFIKRKSKIAYLIINIFLLLPIFSLNNFFSLKRIALLRIFFGVSKTINQNVNIWYIFLFTFCLDFLFGSFKNSPLSFTYSFLFLGLILTHVNKPKVFLPLLILGGQLIISWHQSSSLTILGVIFGFISTGIFSIMFPFLVIGFLFNQTIPSFFLEIPIEYFIKLLTFLSKISSYLGEFNSSLYLICTFIFMILFQNKYFTLLFLIFLTLAHTSII